VVSILDKFENIETDSSVCSHICDFLAIFYLTKVNNISCLTLYKGAEAITLNIKIITRCRSDTIEATYFQLTHKSQDHKDS